MGKNSGNHNGVCRYVRAVLQDSTKLASKYTISDAKNLTWLKTPQLRLFLVFRYLPGSSAKAAAVLVCEWLKLVSNWACTATVEGVDMALAVIATN